MLSTEWQVKLFICSKRELDLYSFGRVSWCLKNSLRPVKHLKGCKEKKVTLSRVVTFHQCVSEIYGNHLGRFPPPYQIKGKDVIGINPDWMKIPQ